MIAVIADDFTGAAEIAGLGWRHGLKADLLTRSEPVSEAELVVYDSDSRNCSPAEAGRRAARLFKQVRARKPDWIFKKVDSVLRGNVAVEIEAALAALQLKRCLLVSANPDAGRIIRRGRYFLNGTPLDQTDFRHDPRHPRRSAEVLELAGRPDSSFWQTLPAGTKSTRPGVNIGEVSSFNDVQHWAALATGEILAAGGADFFRALLLKHGCASRSRENSQRKRRIESPMSPSLGRRVLFVSGSPAEAAAAFLGQRRNEGWPVITMPDPLLEGGRPGPQSAWVKQILRAFQNHSNVVAAIGQPPLPGKSTPVRLGKTLIAAVEQVIASVRPDLVCVEGGATTALLVKQMGWRRLKVEFEYATGVVALRPCLRPELALVCKPGSYCWPRGLIHPAREG